MDFFLFQEKCFVLRFLDFSVFDESVKFKFCDVIITFKHLRN